VASRPAFGSSERTNATPREGSWGEKQDSLNDPAGFFFLFPLAVVIW
jgi:hypothetical protein